MVQRYRSRLYSSADLSWKQQILGDTKEKLLLVAPAVAADVLVHEATYGKGDESWPVS